MRQSYRFVVRGRVQGVFFRQSTQQIATRLGLHGWVHNRTDGAVEGVVSGEIASALEEFRLWLGRGPARAQVEVLDWTSVDESVAAGFEVRR